MLTILGSSDGKMVERVLRGQREAFGLLVRRHYAGAYAIAYARLGRRSDAEDAVQEAFLKAFEKLDTLRDPNRFGPWLLSIATHAALGILRKRHREESTGMELMDDDLKTTPDPERYELHAAVRAGIMALEEGPREILLLHYFAGKRLREIASLLEITPNAAKLRLQRARATLGKHLLDLIDGGMPLPSERRSQCSRIMLLVGAMPVAWDQASAATTGGASASSVSVGMLSVKASYTLLLLFVLGCLGGFVSHLWMPGRQQAESEASALNPGPASENRPIPQSGVSASARGMSREAAAPGATGMIAGVLVDAATQMPISGPSARVIGSRGSTRREVEVTEQGEFQFSGLPSGVYEISAQGDFIVAPERPLEVNLGQGQSVKNLRVSVARGGLVSGRVYDSGSGQGVPMAALAAYLLSGDAKRLMETHSDATGTFRLAGLPAGLVRVECAPPQGFARPRIDAQQAAVVAGQSLTNVDFAIDHGIAVSGVVIDEQGSPVADVQVLGRGKDGGSASETRSRADGAFTLRGLNPTTELYVIGVAEGYGCLPAGPFALTASNIPEVLVKLLPEGSIEGRVVDNLNKPVTDARVSVEPAPSYLFDPPQSRPDDGGVFLLSGLAPGPCQLKFWVSGAEQARPPGGAVHVEKGEAVKGIVLRYVRGNLSISGRVTNLAGDPLPGLNLSCVGSHEGQTVTGDADTDADGNYEIKGLGAGAYEIHLFHPDYMAARRSGIEAGARNVDIQLGPAAIIEGRVLKMDDTPFTDFEVLVHPGWLMEVAPWMEGEFVHFHDEEGRFSLKAVDGMGAAFVAARAPGFAPAAVQTGATPGAHVENLVIRLKPARSVQGVVTDSAGSPIEGALVFSGGLPENATPEAGSEARTDAAGKFVLDPLLAGATKVSAYRAGYSPGWCAVPDAADTPVQIVLPAQSMLSGRLTMNGKPVAADWVKVTYTEPGALREKQAQTAADGTYRFDDLPPGLVDVSAVQYVQTGIHSVGHNLAVRAEIAAGMETTVDLNFTPGTASLRGTVYLADVPVSGGEVVARSQSGEGEVVVEDGLEATGGYEFYGLPEGPLQLEIAIGGTDLPRKNKSESLVLHAGDDNTHDVHFDATGGRLTISVNSGQQAEIGIARGVIELNPNETPFGFYRRIEALLVWEGESTPGVPLAVEGLDPGEYTVIAVEQSSGAESRRGAAVTKIDDGEEGSIAVELSSSN